MMKFSLILFYIIVCAVIFGCRKENPVQLLDDETQTQGIEVLNSSISVEPFDASGQDTVPFFYTSSDKQYWGRLVIAGSEYDNPVEHHEASLARVVFFDRHQPVIFNGDTVGYKTVDAGTVSIDKLSLRATPELLHLPGLPSDTVGTNYSLLDIDGAGGKGLQYYGSHMYQWDISGSLSIPPFLVTISSPENLHVSSPAAGENIYLSRNLHFQLTGGGDIISLIISDLREGAPARPLLQLRIRKNTGNVIIPSRILQLLPEGRSRFLFTFSSEYSLVEHLNGYGENIIARAITSHSIEFHVIR